MANATVSGVLSGPYDRYQSRVMWLILLSCIVIVMSQRGAGHESPPADCECLTTGN
jgi:hypothetical protein